MARKQATKGLRLGVLLIACLLGYNLTSAVENDDDLELKIDPVPEAVRNQKRFILELH